MYISLVLIFLFLIIGVILGYIFSKYHVKSQINFLVSTIQELRGEKEKLDDELRTQTNEILKLNRQIVAVQSNNNNYIERLQEQKDDILQMQSKLTVEFENLANKIFEEKSNRFTKQNQDNIGQLLTPLGEKIKEFEFKVNDVYDKDNKERISLKTQIEELSKLNKVMNEETKNLTRALKGDTQIQGSWGEMVLESILQKSGLVEGREYFVQLSITQDGSRYRPDVVIKLPDNKSVIIDSKVTLTAYERLLSEDKHDVAFLLKEHIQSIKNHIKNLSGKNYQQLYELNSLDFVLMFVPIEAAFMLAVNNDNTIIDEALNKNIIIVCPSTLLATLRTVYSIWRTEKSIKNFEEIATVGGELYERFIGLLEALSKVEKSIENVKDCYNNAITKISGNKGITKSVAKLKDLGAKTNKLIENKWLESTDDISN
ncbi:MAG: DNA recombination protein RmuC [Burkholderiales bacterium]|nr:DNA recombination protein RmuC [Burkholderiales bacterium]